MLTHLFFKDRRSTKVMLLLLKCIDKSLLIMKKNYNLSRLQLSHAPNHVT
jgi:hypothetical protein